jgi:hypothetical protein
MSSLADTFLKIIRYHEHEDCPLLQNPQDTQSLFMVGVDKISGGRDKNRRLDEMGGFQN